MSTTLVLPGADYPEVDPHEIRDRLEHELGAVIDGGGCSPEPTTVLDMTEGVPQVLREGLGSVEPLF
jgi:tRNA A37 threonylcarbamoyladenosine synthetase subunit TsaC/SUA5/YrdC